MPRRSESQPRSRGGIWRPDSMMTWSFAAIVVVQAVICLVLEAYAFAELEIYVNNYYAEGTNTAKATTVYLALFIFGFFYQLILTYWALKTRNTIQIIMLCIFNAALLIYSAIQTDQFRDITSNLLVSSGLWDTLKAYLIAIPCILGLGSVVLAGLAWKLQDEFAWTIYKNVSADLRLKRRFLIYQVYVALLQLDFFFFVGFTIQFLVVVSGTTEAEFVLTIIALPLTMVVLIAAYWITRRENTPGMIAVIVFYFAAFAYFLFKLIRMYHAPTQRLQQYSVIRKSLTVFACLTILLLIATIINAIWCLTNFKKGLKPIINKSLRSAADVDRKTSYDHDISMGSSQAHMGAASERMTID